MAHSLQGVDLVILVSIARDSRHLLCSNLLHQKCGVSIIVNYVAPLLVKTLVRVPFLNGLETSLTLMTSFISRTTSEIDI